MRVVVVGAGIVGSAIALQLADAGADVTVIEASLPGRGATGASFAWANARHKRPRDYFELSFAALTAHDRLVIRLGSDEWWRQTGGLQWIAANDEVAAESLVERRAWGYPVKMVSRHEAAGLEPDVRFPEAAGELAFYPSEGFVFGTLLVAALLAAAAERGAVIRTATAAIGFATVGHRVSGVRIASGEVIAGDAVVVAAGAGTPALIQDVGVRLPIAERGQTGHTATGRSDRGIVGLVAITEKVPARVSRVIHVPQLHFRPDGGGRLLLQDEAVEAGLALDLPRWPPPAAALELLRRAQEVVRYLDSIQLEAVNLGLRPLPLDGLPITGWVPDLESLYVAVCHSGMTLGPALGELIAAEVLQGVTRAELDPYRPAGAPARVAAFQTASQGAIIVPSPPARGVPVKGNKTCSR
jgi:glycine/D-amino acid oxidase-like deaminating enzyme